VTSSEIEPATFRIVTVPQPTAPPHAQMMMMMIIIIIINNNNNNNMYIYFEETDCEVMDLIEVAQDNAE
jgi:hypothetical protein